MALVLRSAAFALGLNYGAHIASSKLYDVFCVPHSLQDILYSMVTTASPACSTLLNVMTSTQSNYAAALTGAVLSGVSSLLAASYPQQTC